MGEGVRGLRGESIGCWLRLYRWRCPGGRGGGRVSSGGGCLQSDVGYLISGDLNLFGLNGLVVAGWE